MFRRLRWNGVRALSSPFHKGRLRGISAPQIPLCPPYSKGEGSFAGTCRLVLGRLVVLGFAIVLTTLTFAPVQAQEAITVTTGVVARFPLEINYQVSAQSTVAITDIRLHYAVKQMGFVDVTAEAFPLFTPGPSVTAQWKWDMRRSGGLPPGTLIDYWWTVRDAAGNSVETPRTQLAFEDTRFTWKTVTSGKISILWYEGSQAFAQEILDSAVQAEQRLARETGAALKEDVRIYIYGNTTDLRGSMIFPQEWTGGVAFTRFGKIAIGISPLNLTWGKRAIAHELTHLINQQMTLNPYNELPVWLEEGLAMYNEGPMQPEFESALKRGIDGRKLFSLQTLSSPFSSYADQSFLSYAESRSVVDYLIRTYGRDKMFQLLETFRQGSTYDGALTKVYGLNTDTLNAAWQATLLGTKTSRGWRAPGIAVAALGVPSLLGLTMALRRRTV